MSYKIPEEFLGRKREDLISNDIRFMLHALTASLGSEDPSTQVGSCYVSKDGKLLSVGYNTGLWDPSKFPYEGNTSIGIENTKYPYINHAEVMGVFNYKGSITDFKDSTLYVTLKPCENCARLIGAIGVKRIVCLNERKYNDIPTNDVIIDNCNIEYVNLKDIMDVAEVSFDLTQNEKKNTKILRLKKEDN